jgi:hypothetical protein
MPLTKAAPQVINIDAVSDALAQNSGNAGGILEYITTQIDDLNTALSTTIDNNLTTLQDQIDAISTGLTTSGLFPIGGGNEILFKNANLSGLTNIPLARTNLGIVSASTTTAGLITIASYSEISTTGPTTKAVNPKHVYDAIKEFAIDPLTADIDNLTSTTFKIANNFNEFSSNETAKATARFNLGIGISSVGTNGLVKLAPTTAVDTHTAANSNVADAITPALLSKAMGTLISRDKSGIGGNLGYFEFPNGFIAQWIRVPVSSQVNPITITLPKPLDGLTSIIPSYTRDLTDVNSIPPVSSYTHNTISNAGQVIGFNQYIGIQGSGGTISYPSSFGAGHGFVWFLVIGKVNPTV